MTTKKKTVSRVLTKLTNDFNERLEKEREYPACCDPDMLGLPEIKIVAVIAETSTWEDADGTLKSHKLSCGMAAAQACHVVSKIKMEYIKIAAEKYDKDRAIVAATHMVGYGVTTIILKARDSQEVDHIIKLANNKGLLWASFKDSNDKIYGNERVLTAAAIGPINDLQLFGITDYLPLWKCGCD